MLKALNEDKIMHNKKLVCCPFCSKKLTRSWDENPSQIPSEEYQSCEEHTIVSTYSWPPSVKSVDVRTEDVMKLFPREEQISPEEIGFLYRYELDKMLKYESHNIDWNHTAIYEKCKAHHIDLNKTHSSFINFKIYYRLLKQGVKHAVA